MAFLFLGELFLIPHLLPIAVALARQSPTTRIDLLVISNVHERIVAEFVERSGLQTINIVRARGYRNFAAGAAEIGRLRPKLLTLAMNARWILRHDVAVVAERTSLWLPVVAMRRGARFIYNEHGAAPHANFGTFRNRFADHIMMPSAGMAAQFRERGHANARVSTVGYIKRDYLRDAAKADTLPFPDPSRPTIVYVPHWKRSKSSWWDLGPHILHFFSVSSKYNLILAPHQRMLRSDKDFQFRVKPFLNCPNILIDAKSFNLVDRTYIDLADLYIGDGSSQVVEFAERPRPIVFLNPQKVDWRSDPRFSHWQMGEVVTDIGGLTLALGRGDDLLDQYGPVQTAYVQDMMGIDDGAAAQRAATIVERALKPRAGRAN